MTSLLDFFSISLIMYPDTMLDFFSISYDYHLPRHHDGGYFPQSQLRSGSRMHDSLVISLVILVPFLGFSKKGELDPSVPFGIFDGKRFLLRTGVFSIINSIKILWRYGLDLFRLKRSVSSLLDNFSSIYELQESGKAYSNLHDMLEAMGGEHMYGLTQVSAHDYMRGTLNWNEKLVDELITGALRVNYGQDTSVNAFTAYVALAGMEDGKLWSVVDGNWQIPAKVLEESAATVLSEDVTKVSKVVNQNGQTKYHINTSGGGDDGLDYDVVIVANPLNLSSVEYENFSGNVYTPAATTPYHTTVATFIKGIIKQDFFGEDPKQNNFPQNILTKDMEGCPIQFNSIGSEIPSEIKQDQVKDYTKPLQDDPMRVWKVFSNESHSPTDWQQIFTDIQSTFTKKWSAYPQYHPPDEAPPFILDDGVFYVNAIEKAASAMEMSAIGAKNAALLAREYILEQQKLFE